MIFLEQCSLAGGDPLHQASTLFKAGKQYHMLIGTHSTLSQPIACFLHHPGISAATASRPPLVCRPLFNHTSFNLLTEAYWCLPTGICYNLLLIQYMKNAPRCSRMLLSPVLAITPSASLFSFLTFSPYSLPSKTFS